jgi:PKD repeat protein
MVRMPKNRHRERSRGQSVVEFAMIAPVLVFLLLITLDFGRLFMSYITLTNTARVAANYAATNPGAFTGTPNTAVYDAIIAREGAGLNCDLQAVGGHNPPIPTFVANGLGKQTGLGATAVASMTCDFSLLTPFITGFFGGPLAISAKAEFPIHTGAIANIGGSTTLPPPGSPIADFTFTGVSGGTPDGSGNVTGVGTVTVNVLDGSSAAQTYEWDWGDLSPHEFVAVPAPHSFSTPGTYTVSLTVNNPIGTSVRTRTVTVTNPPAPIPVAGFYGSPIANPPKFTAGGGATGTPITGERNLAVQFTNVSTDGTAYSWNFGDGTAASTATNPSHTYTDLKVFTVTLTVTAPTGGNPLTRSAYVTTGCVVPNFAPHLTNEAEAMWDAAGFKGNTSYQAGPGGPVKNNPPNPPKVIQSQSGLVGGTFVPATPTGPGGKWECAGDITLVHAP